MKKKKTKGFSLMEVCIAVTLMGIMVSVGGIKLRNHIAITKNVKAASILKTLRTASELYYSEHGEAAFSLDTSDDKDILTEIEKLKEYLDNKTYTFLQDNKGYIPIGGSQDEKGNIFYGGKVVLTAKGKEIEKNADGVNLWLTKSYTKGNTEGFKRDLKGKRWLEY